MKEVLEDIRNWQSKNEPIALATVVQTWGSAPRKAGAKMAIMADGSISGSVSGGCVEGAVFEEGTEALETDTPKLLHYGVADETAWDVGLACGGIIEVFVEPLETAVFQTVADIIDHDRSGDNITIIQGPDDLLGNKLVLGRDGQRLGSLGSDALDEQATASAKGIAKSQRIWLSEEVEIFIDAYRPALSLIIVGGVHIAQALVPMAKLAGYAPYIIDPREAFGSEARFPGERVINDWPDEALQEVGVDARTALVLLTHDPKLDDPALQIALNSNAFYIGALGSTRTHAKRVARLEAAGFSADQIDRINGPIGLDIGAASPPEIAVSILAQMVATRRQGA